MMMAVCPVLKNLRHLNSTILPPHGTPRWTAESKPSYTWAKAEQSPAPHLHNPMADGAILPLPQHHQADDDDCGNGHRNDQQANKSTAAQTKVLPQRSHRFLK